MGVSVSLTGTATQTTGGVSYGGVPMTLALGDAATSARSHTYLYYLATADFRKGCQLGGRERLRVPAGVGRRA